MAGIFRFLLWFKILRKDFHLNLDFKMKKLIILLIGLYFSTTLITTKDKPSKVLMCYIMSWSVFRPEKGRFNIDNIDPRLCTHIVYAYHIINQTTWKIESDDKWADYNLGGIRKLVDLKKDNPYLKILICVGGWSEGSEKFSQMSADKEKRNVFVESVVKYLEKHNLDGLDIDWQFPAQRGGVADDRDNFVTLLQDLRNEFNPKGYTLTVRLMGSRFAAEGYDLLKISHAVHYINLKSYSYHGNWEEVIGINSPLKANDESNVLFSVDFIISSGVESFKLLLGLCTEGNALIIDEEVTDKNYIGKKSSNDFIGPWLGERGVIGFNELCWMFKREGDDWSHHWDESSSTPYSVKGNQFTSYDDQQSFQDKLELVSLKNLGGVSLFSLDKDDFNGLCFNKTFILTKLVKSYLSIYDLDVHVLNQEYPR